MLYRYLVMAKIPVNSDMYIFRGLRFDKKSRTTCLRKADKPVSYGTIREDIKYAISGIHM